MEEMRQSLKIIRQALDIFPGDGPGQLRRLARRAAAEGRRVPRHGVAHLPLQARSWRASGCPPGERYEWIEGANGELGFYAISDGGGGPYRLKVRPPCFPIMAAFEKIVVGGTDLRRGRDARDPERHRRRARPMSGVVDVGARDARKLTLSQRLYLPEILRGMAVTIRHLAAQPRRDPQSCRRSCTPSRSATTRAASAASTS